MNKQLLTAKPQTWLLAGLIILILASVLPRFYALGETSFQGDEEYTALTASAILAGKEASMPSGMPYLRSLPLSYLSAASASILGPDEEFSYRLPAALLGAITPLVLFLLLRSMLGGTIAFVIALAIALSEWHILISREARMYAPFLLFFTTSAICIWRWIESSRLPYLIACIPLYFVGMTFHQLTLLTTMFVFLPYVTSQKTTESLPRAIALFLLLLIPTIFYFSNYVDPGYDYFPRIKVETGISDMIDASLSKLPIKHMLIALLLALFGSAVGYWLARSRKQGVERLDLPVLGLIAFYMLAVLTGLFAVTGLIYAAVMTGILFLSMRNGLPPLQLRTIAKPLILLAMIAIGWLAFSVLTHGLHGGLKNLASVPFPYLAYLLVMYPGGTLLFLLTCIFAVKHTANNTADVLRISIFATLVPILLIGLVRDWGGARYIIGAYLFFIFASVIGLVTVLNLIAQSRHWWGKRGTLILATIVVASGVLGGAGIPNAIRVATMGHGDPGYWSVLGFPTQPDHRSAGHYVREHLRDSDIVVAEDASMQTWYSGRVDFWLRKFDDARQFLYQPDDGLQYDIYVSSRIVTKNVIEEFDQLIASDRRIWIITSGETSYDPNYYLDDFQRQWLDQIDSKQKPRHIGLDGVTKVYCLGCPD